MTPEQAPESVTTAWRCALQADRALYAPKRDGQGTYARTGRDLTHHERDIKLKLNMCQVSSETATTGIRRRRTITQVAANSSKYYYMVF